jgi:hypothetical protein
MRRNTHYKNSIRALFPNKIDGLQFIDWFFQSLENGNGDISPRQVILFLVLIKEAPDTFSHEIKKLPIINENNIIWAMTQLSELSFSEVLNDFRIAKTFLRNCRAGKLNLFQLEEVEQLFDVSEGPLALQVELLERLGFLERIVVKELDGKKKSKLRIPSLFTRCWGPV